MYDIICVDMNNVLSILLHLMFISWGVDRSYYHFPFLNSTLVFVTIFPFTSLIDKSKTQSLEA